MSKENMYYNTDVMIAAIKQANKKTTFLRDRYFPKREGAEFISADVLVEFENSDKLAAPFVVPRIGGVAIDRNGYKTKRYTPANIEPKTVLTIDDAEKKLFGEAIYANMTPEERTRALLGKDLTKLGDIIDRREEAMAAEVLFTNKLVMKHLKDDGTSEEREIRFYDGATNPQQFTPTVEWDEANATIIEDLYNMCEMVDEDADPVDLLVSPTAWQAMRNNTKIQKYLDMLHFNMGDVAPEKMADGATLLGKINADGYMLNIIMYNKTYKDVDGTTKKFIPEGKVCVTAKEFGQRIYGAVSQIEENDLQLHTYSEARVPKKYTNVANDMSELKITSKPLVLPMVIGAFCSATVVS